MSLIQLCLRFPHLRRGSCSHYRHLQRPQCRPRAQHAGVRGEHPERRRLHRAHQVRP